MIQKKGYAKSPISRPDRESFNHSGSFKTTEKVIRLTFFVTTNFSLYHAHYDFCNAIFSHFFLFATLRLCVKLILFFVHAEFGQTVTEGAEGEAE